MVSVDTAFPTVRARNVESTRVILAEAFAEMQPDVAASFAKGNDRIVPKEWDLLLADRVLAANTQTATDIAHRLAAGLGTDYDVAIMDGWLAENARITAEGINATTGEDIILAAHVAEAKDAVQHVFHILTSTGAAGMAQRMVTTAGGFASHDVAEKAGAQVKTWVVNSRNPRSAHRRMNGETVPLSENFSNGMAWPGDPIGGPANNARCKCSLTIVR